MGRNLSYVIQCELWGQSFSPPLNKDVEGYVMNQNLEWIKKHPPENYEWNLDSPTMDEAAAKIFYMSSFVCTATERKKHKDFWVMKSFV